MRWNASGASALHDRDFLGRHRGGELQKRQDIGPKEHVMCEARRVMHRAGPNEAAGRAGLLQRDPHGFGIDRRTAGYRSSPRDGD